MNETTRQATTPGAPKATRRAAVLGTLAATMAGAGMTIAAASAAHPDAALLAALSEFDALELRIKASYGAIDDEAEGETFREPLHARQDTLLDQIFDLRAATLDGWTARARSMLIWDECILSNDGGTWPAVMLAALLRDLLGPAELARIEAIHESARADARRKASRQGDADAAALRARSDPMAAGS